MLVAATALSDFGKVPAISLITLFVSSLAQELTLYWTAPCCLSSCSSKEKWGREQDFSSLCVKKEPERRRTLTLVGAGPRNKAWASKQMLNPLSWFLPKPGMPRVSSKGLTHLNSLPSTPWWAALPLFKANCATSCQWERLDLMEVRAGFPLWAWMYSFVDSLCHFIDSLCQILYFWPKGRVQRSSNGRNIEMYVIAWLGCSTGNLGSCFQGFRVKALAPPWTCSGGFTDTFTEGWSRGWWFVLLMVSKSRTFHQTHGARDALCCPSTTGETLLLIQAASGGWVKYGPKKLTFLYSTLCNLKTRKL